MALIDLHFADAGDKAKFNCNLCMKNPVVARGRRCEEDGYENLKAPMKVDKHGQGYMFCPGKATWSEEAADLFTKCKVAVETGILPESGGFWDQEKLFTEVFPDFVERWKAKRYRAIWGDVREYVEAILKALFKK